MSPLLRINLSMPVIAWVACHWHEQSAHGNSRHAEGKPMGPRVQGLEAERCQGGHVAYEGQLRSRAARLRVTGQVYAMRTLFWLASTTSALWAGLREWLWPHAPPACLPA